MTNAQKTNNRKLSWAKIKLFLIIFKNMRGIIYIFIFCLAVTVSIESTGQSLLFSNFEPRDTTRWEDSEEWRCDPLSPISGQYSFRHNRFATGGKTFLWKSVGANQLEEGTYRWDITVRSGDWQLADSENWFLALAIDQKEIDNANGYIVGVNLIQPDNTLKICRLNNGKISQLILNTGIVWKAQQTNRLIVNFESGNWKLTVTDRNEPTMVHEFQAENGGIIFPFSYTGFHFRYSSAHGGQLWLDDLSMSFERKPPSIDKMIVLAANHLKIVFNGNIGPENLQNGDRYQITTLSGSNCKLESVTKAVEDSTIVYLIFQPGGDTEFILTTNRLTDKYNQPLSNPIIIFSNIVLPLSGKLVINEIMADPTPIVGLPDAEYIELYNHLPRSVNLRDWKLSVNQKTVELPDTTIVADGYFLLTGTTIHNDRAEISLIDPSENLSDRFIYLRSMHRSTAREGGFSLERIDPDRFCNQYQNWETSVATAGGTPGKINSVYARNQDNEPPYVISSKMKDPRTLAIRLSEKPDTTFPLSDCIEVPAAINYIDQIEFSDNDMTLNIQFGNSVIGNGGRYQIKLVKLTDECGNIMTAQTIDFGYFLPENGDIVINEVLFHPLSGGAEFIELYNNSLNTIDLSDLFWGIRESSGKLTLKPIFDQYFELKPGEYVALTSDREKVALFYRTKCPDCLAETASMPGLNNESGTILLLNSNNEIIDQFNYNNSYHDHWITHPEGISLERILFDSPTEEPGNWHSAAKSSGGATPGYQNSIVVKEDNGTGLVSAAPAIFSPNDDGYNDFLEILLNPNATDWLTNIRVYNASGIEIRRLANNLSIGPNDRIIWDGKDDNHNKSSVGIYILHIEMFQQEGHSKSYKISCAITDKLE